ncbi:MAG TPA: amidase family protein, partial [Terricaulis sp.]|nr:amidase family protein [Terricaulis sp.]
MNFALSRRALMANAVALGALTSACARTAPSSDALGDSDAVGLAQRIREGEITATQAVEAAIARAERVNPQLNFIVTPAYEAGRTRAAEALTGPFAGVPTLVKDLMDWAGHATKHGSRAFANNIAAEQPPYMDAMLAAGLVPFAKSTTPEFGFTATTEPMLGGATRNPWNTERSSGGSSGGAGVAVAARVVPVAHASDGGGSIRIPASCNGLVGLKPSRARNIGGGAANDVTNISVQGCVSRSVRDTAGWQAAMENSGEGRAFDPIGLVTGPNTRRLRIKLDINNALGNAPHADVGAAMQQAAELCRGLGHTVA